MGPKTKSFIRILRLETPEQFEFPTHKTIFLPKFSTLHVTNYEQEKLIKPDYPYIFFDFSKTFGFVTYGS